MKTIKTKSKEQFLQSEFVYYKRVFKDYKEYVSVMEEDIMCCKKCGAYYWYDCNKVCKC